MTWTQKANIKGTQGIQGIEGAQGLPGTNAIENDAAVAAYISTGGTSATKTAADARYALKTQLDLSAARVVYHLADAAYVRPTASGAVMWIGSITPTNMINGDVYLSTVPVEPPLTWHANYSAKAMSLDDNTAVASLTDQSGNGRHATQATGAKQPIYKAGAVPYVRFDGVDDHLKTAAFGADLTQPMTLMMAVRLTTITVASSPVKYLFDGIDSTKTVLVLQRGVSGGAGTEVWQAGAGTPRNGPTTKKPVAGAWAILTFVANGPTGSYFRVNGVQTAMADYGANVLAGLSLGANYLGTGSFADFDLGDLRLASGVLSNAQVVDMETFLANRYTVSLG